VATLQQIVDWEIKPEKALRHILDLFFFLKNREKEIIYNSFVTYYTYVCECEREREREHERMREKIVGDQYEEVVGEGPSSP